MADLTTASVTELRRSKHHAGTDRLYTEIYAKVVFAAQGSGVAGAKVPASAFRLQRFTRPVQLINSVESSSITLFPKASDNPATAGVEGIIMRSAIPDPNTGTVVDNDNAATVGTALNVVPGQNGVLAYLESTLAGDVDTTFRIGSGGPIVFVNDNNAPDGVALFFDEDATDPDSRFKCVSPTAADLFVMAANGTMIRVAHNAGAAGEARAYIDDDAAQAHLKLLFVSPTNTNGTYVTDDAVSSAQPIAPVNITGTFYGTFFGVGA